MLVRWAIFCLAIFEMMSCLVSVQRVHSDSRTVHCPGWDWGQAIIIYNVFCHVSRCCPLMSCHVSRPCPTPYNMCVCVCPSCVQVLSYCIYCIMSPHHVSRCCPIMSSVMCPGVVLLGGVCGGLSLQRRSGWLHQGWGGDELPAQPDWGEPAGQWDVRDVYWGDMSWIIVVCMYGMAAFRGFEVML